MDNLHFWCILYNFLVCGAEARGYVQRIRFSYGKAAAQQATRTRDAINRIFKNKCLLVWHSFNLIWKPSRNHLWHICNLLGSNLFWNSTVLNIYYWRPRRWKLNIQRLILKVQAKQEQVSSWTNSQLAAFSSVRRKYWDSIG